ncbi:methylaspartate mutase [Amycolatopsis sp. OK19-0408]|uniref:Methylaspartate mutase n=1 Tax=Amycolatopsis iheyensis TaxID=2945988 RepID=A0A9X2NF91_9PSEU|nr:methylaspartate mutase [Amycolatopsis iheyensis]MCR6485765.1 methylaspartate mutase [Amycolatopsis iheyensis]
MLTGSDPAPTGNAFADFVSRAHRAGRLVVQPRMGFSDPRVMRSALLAVRGAAATTAGTLTLDSYTRVGDHESARQALVTGTPLNGYPLVAHGRRTNRAVLTGVSDVDFPVQVRHGSAIPQRIMTALLRAGLDATEGGPVSYCLPYGRTPLRHSVRNWEESCAVLGQLREAGIEPHVETFGGCLMGQLCPPSLLVAVSLLEALFFKQHGLRTVSLSYAQQANPQQDREALRALRTLATRYLGDIDWHLVVYAYMGLFPRTGAGALLLLEEAAKLAVECGAARLIVKTVAESARIPSVAENVQALETANLAALGTSRLPEPAGPESGVLAEAGALVRGVLELDGDVGRALVEAFRLGRLDVPFCLHPDNARRTRSHLGADGRLSWADIGGLPIGDVTTARGGPAPGSAELLSALSFVRDEFDRAAAARSGKQWRTTTPIGRTT